ncbi:hypothetical protein IJ098_00390 [Candidatus Saccharibacteria bacterium]|nr:hypothetical protein [Candidatus Saccharibacteria bacterium]
MKRYKLLKELPTFQAGDIFTLDEDGCLYLTEPCDFNNHWKSRVMAYHKNTLERFPNILEDWFEEIESTKTERIRELLEELKDEIDNYLELEEEFYETTK